MHRVTFPRILFRKMEKKPQPLLSIGIIDISWLYLMTFQPTSFDYYRLRSDFIDN